MGTVFGIAWAADPLHRVFLSVGALVLVAASLAVAAGPAFGQSGKAAPATTTSTTDNGKAKEGTPAKAQTDAAKPAEPAKKKGLFHKLKKVVDPF